jgi:hypothetical protein
LGHLSGAGAAVGGVAGGGVISGQVTGRQLSCCMQFVHATSSAVQGPHVGQALTSLHKYGSYWAHVMFPSGKRLLKQFKQLETSPWLSVTHLKKADFSVEQRSLVGAGLGAGNGDGGEHPLTPASAHWLRHSK